MSMQTDRILRGRGSPEMGTAYSDGSPSHGHSSADPELIEALEAIVFQQRLVQFADELEGADRVIFERRMLAHRPAPIASLAAELGVSFKRAATMVRDVERRLRAALRGAAACQVA